MFLMSLGQDPNVLVFCEVFLCEPLDLKWVEPFLAEDDRALAFQQKEIFL